MLIKNQSRDFSTYSFRTFRQHNCLHSGGEAELVCLRMWSPKPKHEPYSRGLQSCPSEFRSVRSIFFSISFKPVIFHVPVLTEEKAYSQWSNFHLNADSKRGLEPGYGWSSSLRAFLHTIFIAAPLNIDANCGF